MNKGFTLLETLVMIAVLSIVGAILAATLTQIYRGQAKVNLTAQIKQNGQVALDQLEKILRFSEEAICTNATHDKLVVKNKGIYQRIQFVPAETDANAAIKVDTVDQQLCLSAQTACNLACGSDPGIYITNRDSKTGVSVYPLLGSGFTITRLPGFKDIVSVAFNAGMPLKTTPSYDSQGNPLLILFKTSIELR